MPDPHRASSPGSPRTGGDDDGAATIETAVPRSTRSVVDDHIRCRREARLEEDLTNNYADDVVVLSAEGVHRGHDGVRHLARILHRYLPDATYDVRHVFVVEDVALELWRGWSAERRAHDGADSFLVIDGRIAAQTIHYSVEP